MRTKLTLLLLVMIALSGCQRLDAIRQAGEKVKKTASVCAVMKNSGEEEYTCPYSNEAAEKKENALTEITPTLINMFESKVDLW